MAKTRETVVQAVGLLLLRLGCGGFMAVHGWSKVQKVMAMLNGEEVQFADPLGLGVGPSLFAAAGTEFVCALLVAVGFLTRWAALPVAFTMFVAAFVVHGGDDFATKEKALFYLVAFTALALTGPGKFSVDGVLAGRRSGEE